MKSHTCTIGGKTYTVTRNKTLKAMREFDRRYRPTERDSGTVYAIIHARKRYPPKRIRAMAMGRHTTRGFGGGESTNRIFRGFRFKVIRVVGTEEKTQAAKLLKAPCPSIKKLIRRLFSQKWEHLHENYSRLLLAQYPGVYLVAHSGRNLQGKKTKVRNVFYVGMSHAGVEQRLRGFIQGLKNGGRHSGAKRFFVEWAKRISYEKLRTRKKFYVASVSIPCISNKPTRTPTDLRKMAQVSALEYHALAHIKEKTGKEPNLNKK